MRIFGFLRPKRAFFNLSPGMLQGKMYDAAKMGVAWTGAHITNSEYVCLFLQQSVTYRIHVSLAIDHWLLQHLTILFYDGKVCILFSAC